jgi:protocatechuate 3,4-dioxygenase beta subunit
VDQRKFPLIWIFVFLGAVAAGLVAWGLFGRDGEPSGADEVAVDADGDNDSRVVARRPVARGRDLAREAKATIAGTIRDLEGAAIPGARVCAFAEQDELHGLGDHRPRCTTTGSGGEYRLEGLWPVRTRVEASAPTFMPGRWQTRDEHGYLREQVALTAGRTIEGIDIALRGGGVRVEGVVRDIAGGEIEGALVLADGRRSIQRGTAVAETDETGHFELWVAPGSLRITAMAEGYADGRILAVGPGAAVELFLTPESVLVGQVLDAQTKAPVAGVTVSVRGSRLSTLGRTEFSALSDETGRFRIEGLEPGAYKPIATADELYGEAAERILLGLGETSEPVAILVHPAYFVSGVVTIAGTDGRPCPEGWVSLRADKRTQQRAEIGVEGLVELRAVLPGEYSVELTCEGYLAEDGYPAITLVDESLTGLSWEVREGLAIRGELVDAAGAPLPDVSIFTQMLVDAEDAGARRTDARTRTDHEGRFELLGLLPGRYELSPGQASGGGGRPGPGEPTIVELAPGADVNDVRIVMPATGELRGRVVDSRGAPVAGASIVASATGLEERQSTQTNDAGEFAFEALRPGSTRVSALSQGFGRAGMRAPGGGSEEPPGELVEIVAGETAELELVVEAAAGSITGRVLDESGAPVADAFVDAERMPDAVGASTSRTRQAMRWSWGRKPVLSDQDGRFELDELPEGEFLVRAHRKGGGEAVLEGVALGSDVELVIAETSELGGRVVVFGGPLPERFRVVAREREQGIVVGDEFFRTGGEWVLRELPPGYYDISLSSTVGTAEAEVDLVAGESRMDLRLELQGRVTIRGRIIDLDTGEPIPGFEVNAGGRSGMIRLHRADADAANVTGPDGRFELGDVPTGRVRIIGRLRTGGSDSAYDFAFALRELPPEPAVQDVGDIEAVARRVERGKEPGDLGFSLHEHDPSTKPEELKLEVASVRPGGPAAAAGLEVGAVIESVDGHAIEGDINRYRVLSAIPPGQTILLGLAGGESVEIVAGPPR